MTVPGSGDTNTVECLSIDSLLCAIVQYFNYFVDYIVANGYRKQVDIREAPWFENDWGIVAGEWVHRWCYEDVSRCVEL